MTKVFIHVGTHKTGSTSIQQALRLCTSELKNETLSTIPSPPFFKDIMCLDTLDTKLVREGREFIHRSMEQYSHDHTFVISFEGFSGDINIGYKNSVVVAKTLREMTKDLDVSIIIFLRRQDTFVESAYTQQIHQGGSLRFEEFIGKFDESHFNWLDLVGHYASNFGVQCIHVRSYDKRTLPAAHSLISEFAKIIGSTSLLGYRLETRSNSGYRRDALEIARLCNPYLDEKERTLLRRVLQASAAKQPFESYSFLTFEEREEFLSRYADTNAVVAKKYLDGAPELLFSPPREEEHKHENFDGLSPDVVARILTLGLVYQYKEVAHVRRHWENLVTIRMISRVEEGLKTIAKRSRIANKFLRSIFRKDRPA